METLAKITTIIAIAAAVFLFSLFIVKVGWAWVVPDLFPGAVEQGLIASDISWWVAIKLAIFVSALTSAANIKKS